MTPSSQKVAGRAARIKVALALTLGLLLACGAASAQSVEVQFTSSPVSSADGHTHTVIALVTNLTSEERELTPVTHIEAPLVLGLIPEPFTLAPDESRALFLSILIPTHTPPGAYAISLRITDDLGASVSSEMTARIRERTDLALQTITQQPHDTNRERTIQVAVSNRGNTPQQVQLLVGSTPSASVTIEPDTITLAPDESSVIEITVASPITTTGQQRFEVLAASAITGETLASSRGAFMVLSDRAVVNASRRELAFSVRFDYFSGPNFSRKGLRGFGVSLRGGGLVSADGNQRLRLNLATRGFSSFTGTGAYLSDTLDVILGDAARDYSRFSYAADGYGLTVDARLPAHGVTFGSYLTADRHLTTFTGVGAQVTAAAQGLNGALQVTYNPAVDRAILSATGRVNALAANFGARAQLVDNSSAAGGESRGEDAIADTRSALEELAGVEEDAERQVTPVEEIEGDVQRAITEGLFDVSRLEFAGEGAVDTSGGLGASLQTTLGAGPVTLTGQAAGTTAGFRGAPYSERTFGVGGNAIIAGFEGIEVGLGAQYRATDRFTTSSTHVSGTDAVSLGLAVNASGFSVGATYTSALNSLLQSDSWAHDQRFRVSLNTAFEGGSANANMVWRGRNGSASTVAFDASSVQLNAGVRTRLPGGQLSTTAELEYDLMTSQLVRFEADAVAAMKDVGALTGDLRFGVRYMMDPESSSATGLVRWTGRVAPTVQASAGLAGALTYRGEQVSGSVTTSLSTNLTLPSDHRLGLSGQVRLQGNGHHSVALTASYTVPFTVPIGRIEGRGDLFGRLVTADGEPAPGVEIRVGRAAVITNEQGEFEVLGLAAGQHTLIAPSGMEGVVSNPEIPTRVTVPDGDATDLLFTLYEAAVVNGAVVLTTPDPQPGVAFGTGDRTRDELAVRNLRLALVNEHREYIATTNTLGAFTFPTVLPGVYDLVLLSDLGPLYQVDVLTPTLELAPGQAVSIELLVHPLPRQINLQESGLAGDRNE